MDAGGIATFAFKNQRQMNSTKNLSTQRVFALVAIALFAGALVSGAQDVQHLKIAQPGGMPGMPVLTGIEKTTNGIAVTWDGPSGYYQLLRKWGLAGNSWQPVGGPNLTREATISELTSNAFFRVSGPSPQYAGAQACAECHENIHTTEIETRHAHALETLQNVHQDKNPSCLPCHTVGFGLPTGFVDATTTPQLAGVQCESCHGPAGNHAASEFDLTVRPRVEIAATVCGGCHTGSHHPTFDEFETSAHAEVTEENMNANSCGRCHIGSARLAMLKGEPVPQNDRNIGVMCTVCHDPHGNRSFTNVVSGVVYANQLRNPLSSTNDYFLTTSDVFTNKYDPDINLCAQCHNHRGANWTSSSRPPHHSPQYNMLLGTVGILPNGDIGGPAVHAGTRFVTNSLNQALLITNQCVTCHMQTEEHQDGPPEVAAMTGHSFRVDSFKACVECHGSQGSAQGLTELVHGLISTEIQQVKVALDTWAADTSKVPVEIQSYGKLAWEYDHAGALSNPTGDDTIRGPVSSPNAALDEQKYIPDNIKKARFNLYIVLHDGSYGVHNGPYAFALLRAARDWVQAELNQ